MKKLSLYLLLAIGLVLSSCGDDSGPTVEILSPVSGNAFKQNTDVLFSVRASDEEGLASISITNTLLGLNSFEDLSGTTVSNIEFTLMLNNAPTDKYDVTFTVTDTDGNQESEKIEIEVIE